MKLSLHTANVISIDDPDQRGKIQVRVLPELVDVVPGLLPWALPFMSKQGTTSLSSSLPDVNSTIRVLVNKTWKRFYYLPDNRFFENLFSFSSVTSVITNNITTQTSPSISSPDITYKNLRFELFNDGSLSFHNTSTGEHGFIHKSGSYQFFDANGQIIIHGNSSQPILLQGNVKQYGKSQKFAYYNDLASMSNLIKGVSKVVSDILTPGNFLSASPGSPVVYNPAVLVKDEKILADIAISLSNLLNDPLLPNDPLTADLA